MGLVNADPPKVVAVDESNNFSFKMRRYEVVKMCQDNLWMLEVSP